MYDLAIINGKAFINGVFVKTNVYVLNGKIAAHNERILIAKYTYDARDRLIIPGLIDPHVHFALSDNNADDFYKGSVCCAYGGITTFIDFLDPIERSKEMRSVLHRREKQASKSIVDYSFHMTVKDPKDVKEMVNKMQFYHIKSVKLFTTYSESGRRTFLPEIKELLNYSSLGEFIVMAHIEKDACIDLNDTYKVRDLGKSRPSKAEIEEADLLANLVRETKGKLYMVHLSSGNTLKMLKKNHSDLLNTSFFVESCPHYFVLTDECYEREDGYLYTMAPPLRSRKESEWLNHNFDSVYSIGTDHCSYKAEAKEKDYLNQIPMGIGGVEHAFDIMYHLYGEACIERMTINPAITFGLYPKKGHLGIGADADIMIYDTSHQHIIEKGHSNSDYSVYEGMMTDGKVESTIVGGNFVVKKGELIGGRGKCLLVEE